jgi:hypothetical protein
MLSESYKNRILKLSGILLEISSKEAFDKFYSNKEKFPALNSDENLFNKINQIIPQDNNQFNRGYFEWLYRMYANNKFALNDLNDIKNYLILFKKFINVIPQDKRDINNFKSIDDLYDVVKEFEGREDEIPTSKTQEIKQIKEKEIKKICEVGDWHIYVPLTERASCLVGKGTKWCTSGEEDNMFDDYNENGPLYVILDKGNNKKYQIHLQRQELTDETNRPIDVLHFFEYVSDGELVSCFEKENKTDFHTFILDKGIDELSEGGYSELFFEVLNEVFSGDYIYDYAKEKFLSDMRAARYNEDLVYYGFILEKDPSNISSYDFYDLEEIEEEMLFRIIEHLTEIGYDYESKTGIDFVSFIKAKENLKKLKVNLNQYYKINDRYVISINSIDVKDKEKPYKVTLSDKEEHENKNGNISIETLNNLFTQGLLFQ